MRNAIYALSLGLMLPATMPAFAAEVTAEVRSKIVAYGDLDLTKPAGAATLFSRIKGAAHVVCGSDENRPISGLRVSERCERDAIVGAVTSVNAPALNAYYQQVTEPSRGSAPSAPSASNAGGTEVVHP
jgi:UrcA family protein